MPGLSEQAISGVIRRKVNEWLASIEDSELSRYLGNKVVVSGGAIASLLIGEPVNDFDIYFTGREAAARVARYYLRKLAANPPKMFNSPMRMYVKEEDDRVRIVIQSVGVACEGGDDGKYEFFEMAPPAKAGDYAESVTSVLSDEDASFRSQVADGLADGTFDPESNPDAVVDVANDIVATVMASKTKYRPIFASTNAITLSNKIQLVTRFFGLPDELHENFDFVHCTNYWTHNGLVLRHDALKSLLAKKLKYIGSRYPLCTLIRTRKFVKRGWNAPASVFISAMHQCLSLDWNNIDTWMEQLTGVDAAYFNEIMTILINEKASGRNIDSTYIVELIDRMM